MEQGNLVVDSLLGVHSLLRWLILLLLLLNIFRSFIGTDGQPYTVKDKKWNLRLLIVVHINFLIGLIQYFAGSKGFIFFRQNSFADVMKNSLMRFWAVEHISGMLIAIVIITVTRTIAKKEWEDSAAKHKKLGILYLLALIIILLVIPWPFRENFQTYPWFRSLY